MMMRLLFFLAFVMVLCKVKSQNTISPEISIRSINTLESRSLTNNFFNAFYGGQYIDSTTKWDAIGQLNNKNYLGFFSQNRAEVLLQSEKKISLFFTGSHQSMMGLGFTPELFQLVFAGNDKLVGQQVLMNPGCFERYSFSSLGGGVHYKINDAVSIFAAAGPAVLYSYDQLDFSESSFYTSMGADSLTLQLQGHYSRSSGPAYISGTGFLGEIGFHGKTGAVEWKVMASNLGVFWLNKHSIDSQRDTLMSFTGLQVDDLANISAAVDEELNDIENGLSLKGDTGKMTVSPPFMLFGECSTRFGKLKTDFSLLYYHMPGFIPYASLTSSWPLFTKFRVSLPVKYGAWGSFNAGIGFETALNSRISLSMEFPSLLAFSGGLNSLSYVASGKLIYKISKNESSF